MLRYRPALITVLFFGLGILLFSLTSVHSQWLLLMAISALLCLTTGKLLKKKLLNRCALILIIITAGMTRLYIKRPAAYPEHHITNLKCFEIPVTVHGYIAEKTVLFPNTTRLEIAFLSIDTGDTLYSPVTGNAILTMKNFRTGYGYGDEILARGVLRRPQGLRNPGSIDYRAYLERKDIFVELRIREPADVTFSDAKYGSVLMRSLIEPLRATSEKVFSTFHAGQELEFLKAIILGQRAGLDPGIMEDFRDTGTLHILAVSGLHVGFLVLFFYFFTTLAGIPKRCRYILAGAVIIIYIFVTGAKPPVLRAGIFLIIYYTGIIMERYRNSLNILGVTALILLFINPRDLFDPGFQLSFSAVLGIAFVYSSINDKIYAIRKKNIPFGIPRFIEYVLSLLFMSFGAFAGTALVMAYHFNRLTFTSIFLSVIFVPMAGAVVFLGFLELIFDMCFSWIAGVFSHTTDLLINIMFYINRHIADGHYLTCSISRNEIAWVAAFVILLPTTIYFITKGIRHRYLILSSITTAVMLSASWWTMPENNMTAAFLDVGQGDAVILSFPDGTNWLIDGGPEWENGDAGEQHIIPYLRWAGIRHLNGILLSHPNLDHYGGLESVLEAVRVDTLYETTVSDTLPGLQRLHRIMEQRGTGRRVVSAGERIGTSPYWRAYVLAPLSGDREITAPEDINKVSMVVQFNYMGTKILFTGDIGFNEEQKLLRYGQFLKSDVLKIPHHGSKYSSSAEFLGLVSPEYAVISVGSRNNHGHPTKETLWRLRSVNAAVMRTDLNGMIKIAVLKDTTIVIQAVIQ